MIRTLRAPSLPSTTPLEVWFPAQVASVIVPATSSPVAADYRYTFNEVWRVPGVGWQVKTAGRFGGSLNPGAAIGDTILSVGQYVLARSSDGEAGIAWLLFGASGVSGDEGATPDETEDGAVPALTPNGNLRPTGFVVTNYTPPEYDGKQWVQYTFTPPGPVSVNVPVMRIEMGYDNDDNWVVRQSVLNNENDREGSTETTVYDSDGRMVSMSKTYLVPNPLDADNPILAIKQWTVVNGVLVENNTNIRIEIEGEEIGGSSSDVADETTLTKSGSTFSIKPGGVGSTQLADTAVTPGSYTNTNLTVDQDGRITAASNGSAGSSRAEGAYTAAGNSQGTATAITTDTAVVSGADGVKGVKLPSTTAGMIIVQNTDTINNLKVYPPTGETITIGAVNAANTLNASTIRCYCRMNGSTNPWRIFDLT